MIRSAMSLVPRLLTLRLLGHLLEWRPWRRKDDSALDWRYPKVSRPVKEIKRADRARNGNKIDRAASGDEHGNIPDGILFEVQPYVGCLRAAILVVSSREMLPSRRVVFLPD